LTKPALLFDASSLLILIKELRGGAPNLLLKGSTISLAYYEVGNALWRECFLLNRIDAEEASRLLKAIFTILRGMDVVSLEDEDSGNTILNLAGDLRITYYDAAYLVEAQRSNKILVTDDEKLIEATRSASVKALSSRAILEREL